MRAKVNLKLDSIRPLVEMALAEDIGSGDITTQTTIPARARAKGVIIAKEEGIEFHTLTNPKSIIGDKDDRVTSIECLKYEFSKHRFGFRCDNSFC